MSLNGLFHRLVRVEIGPENGTGIRLGDLRVGFKVDHKASKTVSTATIRVYNAAPASIALLRTPLAVVRLLVGYDPTSKLIFQGPPVKDGIDLRVENADRILVVDAADGGRAYVETFLQVSMTTPTTFGQVLGTVLAQTRWARGFIDPAIEAVQLPHGIVLVGRPAEVMDRLAAAAKPAGADWFIRDNALYVVPRGQSTPEVAPLLSSTQGNLIGSPTSTKDGIKVRALIDATMRPGRAFVVQSLGVSGTYICQDVTFTGDSGWSNEFYMDLTGRPLGLA
jgi:hypothetical protein